MGLLRHTSTGKVLQTATDNTFEELVQAQRIGQLYRLASTPTSRSILIKLGISFATQHGDKVSSYVSLRSHYSVAPNPRNMNPTLHQERHPAQAKALHEA